MILRLCILWAGLIAVALPSAAQSTEPEVQLIAAVERLADSDVLHTFYAERDHAPIWRRKARLKTLLKAVKDAATHGLRPEDYRLAELELLQSQDAPWTPEIELRATRSLAALALDLHLGRVNPVALDPRWNLGGPERRKETLTLLRQLAAADDLAQAIKALSPDHFFYQGLRYVLNEYRAYAEAGGWPVVPSGPSLKPGMTDPRAAILRDRLVVTDAAETAAPGAAAIYDDALVEAVIRFQVRHGLDPDGVVGPKTLGALNVSAEDRVQQTRVNLERARWVLHDLGDEFVIINIAGFDAFLIRGREPVWTSRVVVGRPYRKTPVFKAEISYLVINPTWTVPPTILRKDKLPLIRKDPEYLARSNMVVRTNSGATIDPTTIDWERASASGFPYQIVQRPGPNNALGQIKFMFPNDHFVYLHDTPNRELFDKSVRTFSSGCIRLQNPLDLAERLLADQGAWTRQAIETAIAGGKTRNVTLDHKMPIIIMYWTVQPSPAVGVRFFADVYDRDDAVLAALDAKQ